MDQSSVPVVVNSEQGLKEQRNSLQFKGIKYLDLIYK